MKKNQFLILLLFSVIFTFSCKPKKATPLEIVQLKEGWQFSEAGKNEWLKAKVPGTVHSDLQANKKIEWPYYRDNEKEQFWIEKKDWEYKTTFEVSAAQLEQEQLDLVFEGLDTYATIYLNDSLIKTTNNMFVGWEIPCKKFLKKGSNTLRIVFTSATNITLAQLKANKYLIPCANEYAPDSLRSNVFARKAPYHWGWDWGPRIVTSGIWRPAYLQIWNSAKINDVFYVAKDIKKEKAIYNAKVDVKAAVATTASFHINVNGKEAVTKEVQLSAGINNIELEFEIANPELWWSHGLGKQPLYEVETQLLVGDKAISKKMRRVGVRKLELVQTPDSTGISFLFKLNDVPVFMKGSNYIPADNLLPDVTTERYKKVIKATTDANMNMLRVWGGAIYENDLFYDLCDENGILVWQDFMFACSMIPSGKDHLANIKLEFDENIKRLRNHPSLALWCGNNENMVAWKGWGWQKAFKLTPSDSTEIMNTYQKVFYEMLPQSIKEHDGTHAYWPSSPGGGYEWDKEQNPKSGDVHDWTIWFGRASFADMVAKKQRFISEYGLQSFPEMKTIKSFSKPEDWAYDSYLFDYKQRSMMPWFGNDKKGNVINGNDMIVEYIERYYKKPKNFESLVYLSQLNQAEGMKYIIQGHRSHKPYCWGSMYWQIDDCWPTVSWSSMDYFYRWKAAHYFIRKAYKPVIVNAVIDSLKQIDIQAISDELQNFDGAITYTLLDFAGKEISKKSFNVTLKPNESKSFMKISVKEFLGKANDKNALLKVDLTRDGKLIDSEILYFDIMKNIPLPKPTITTSMVAVDKGIQITLSSNVLAKNVCLSTEKFEGFFSDNYVDIIPDMPIIITYDGTSDMDALKADMKLVSVVDTY